VPSQNNRRSGLGECDIRCSRRVAASHGAPTASYSRDAAASPLAARPPAGAVPAGIAYGLAAHGLVAPSAAVAGLWLAVAIDWPSGLAAVAAPDAAGPAVVWQFAALASGNCHAVVAACWSWPAAVVSAADLADSLPVAVHAVVAVCWSSPDPAAVVSAADLADSLPVAARAVVAVSALVESSAAAGEAAAEDVAAVAVLVGFPASVDWPVVPAASVSPAGPGERKPARQILEAETLLSH
jgi:hypothetical protein